MPRACTCQACSYRVQSPATNCRYGSNCSRGDCRFAHPSPSYSGATKRLAGDEIGRCRYGILCNDIRCEFAHPSPSLKCHARQTRTGQYHTQLLNRPTYSNHFRRLSGHNGMDSDTLTQISGPAAENLLKGYDNGEEYGCLICLANDLQDPMLAEDGRVYCQICIVDWFMHKRPPTSPLTNLRISENLVPRPRRPRVRSVHVDIPFGFDTNLLRQLEGDSNLRRYLQRQYGVTISAPSSSPAAGAFSQSLVLTTDSNMACEDALDVAKAGLEEFLQNPSGSHDPWISSCVRFHVDRRLNGCTGTAVSIHDDKAVAVDVTSTSLMNKPCNLLLTAVRDLLGSTPSYVPVCCVALCRRRCVTRRCVVWPYVACLHNVCM